MFFINLIRSGNSVSDMLIIALAFIVTVVFSIVLHELSHGFIALKNGDYTAKARGRLTLNPIAHFDAIGIIMFLLIGFGWAKPVPVDPRNFRNRKLGMITVSIAGVTTNILLAGIGLLLLFFLYPALLIQINSISGFASVISLLVYCILVYGIQINLMLAAFNILPIYPLDGYNLLNTLLPNNTKYQSFMIKYGFFVLLGLIIIGQIGNMFNLPWLNIFGMFSDLISTLITKITEASLAFAGL